MTTIADALRKGLDSHKRAQQARTEVDAVLRAASQEVSDVLQTPVHLEVQHLSRPTRPQTTAEFALGHPAPSQSYTAVIVRSARGFKEIAEIRFGELGYPITLRWSGDVTQVDSSAAFQAALTRVFQDAATGEKIESLVAGT